MSAKVISFGNQKGGCGKTTTIGIVSYLMSKEYKVLAIDMDPQGNLTKMLTQKSPGEFKDKTVFEGIKEEDVSPYIVKVLEQLDVLPSHPLFAGLPRYLYKHYVGNIAMALDKAIQPTKEQYDFILIDNPPALSENTMNGLGASDYAVIVFETSAFCLDMTPDYYEMIEVIKKNANPKLEFLGIACNLIDKRRTKDNDFYLEAIEHQFPNKLFQNIIERKAQSARLQYEGFFNYKHVDEAVEPFKKFTKELIEHVK